MAMLSYLFLAALLDFAIDVATGAVTPRRRLVYVFQKSRIHPVR
jgi:hypothetical protein